MILSPQHPLAAGLTHDSRLVRAYRGLRSDTVPVWFMRQAGRSLPEGLEYVDSWVEPNFARCFQMMRCSDARLLQQWVLQWRGLGVTFEIVPVVPSKVTREVVAPFLDQPD